MTQYQSLINIGATQEQIRAIKAKLSSNPGLTWEEYYWGVKCIIRYDEDGPNPELIINSLEKAFAHGLRDQKDLYPDACRILSAYYCALGQYDRAINNSINYINTVGEDNSPDWVFHDLINAQLHTGQVELLLANPEVFLADLAHNDLNSKEVAERQINLFRDFLFASADYIREHRNAKVKLPPIVAATATYHLQKSKAWEAFSEVTGVKIELPTQPEGSVKPTVPPTDSKDEITKIRQAYEAAISDIKKQIKERENKIRELQAINEELKKGKKASEVELAGVRKTIDEKEKSNFETREELSRARSALRISEDKYTKLLEETAKGEEGTTALKKELSDIKEKNENLIQELSSTKEKLEIEHTNFLSANRVIEKVQASIEDIQDDFRNVVAEKEKIEKENELLKQKNESLRNENENLRLPGGDFSAGTGLYIPTGDYSPINVIISCYYFLNTICLESGKEWLRKRLPNSKKDDVVQKYFFPVLTDNQWEIATSRGWTRIEDFDLQAILRVINKNMRNIPSFIPDKDDYDLIERMNNVRNDYAHTNGFVLFDHVRVHIETMIDFVRLMHGDTTGITQMRAFVDALPE